VMSLSFPKPQASSRLTTHLGRGELQIIEQHGTILPIRPAGVEPTREDSEGRVSSHVDDGATPQKVHIRPCGKSLESCGIHAAPHGRDIYVDTGSSCLASLLAYIEPQGLLLRG
jgi:hypothetical protein